MIDPIALLRECPIGWDGDGKVLTLRSTSDADIIAWTTKIDTALRQLVTSQACVLELQDELENLKYLHTTEAPRGKEAEELRSGIEELLADPPDDIERALLMLLDNVDARDSLSHLESRDRIVKLEAQLAAMTAARDELAFYASKTPVPMPPHSTSELVPRLTNHQGVDVAARVTELLAVGK